MKAIFARASITALALTSAAHAQQAASGTAISSYLFQSYSAVARDVRAVVEIMPEADLGFRPAGVVREVRTFGEIVAHIAFASALSCEMGDGKPPSKQTDDSTLYRDKARLLHCLIRRMHAVRHI